MEGLVAVSAEAGEADGPGEPAHWLAQVRRQHLPLFGGQPGEVFLCERGIAQHGSLHWKAGYPGEPLGCGGAGAISGE
jgi:hypothetical protein